MDVTKMEACTEVGCTVARTEISNRKAYFEPLLINQKKASIKRNLRSMKII